MAGSVLVIENLPLQTTESEMRKLLRDIWKPISGKQMYDAGCGQARTFGLDPYVKMTCQGGQARIQMQDASLAAQLWCTFPGTYRGHKLKMKTEQADTEQTRPDPATYELKQRPDYTQQIASNVIHTATGAAERWDAMTSELESAGDHFPHDFDVKGSMINSRKLIDHRGGYDGLMEQAQVTPPPGQLYQEAEHRGLAHTKKQWLTSSLDLGSPSGGEDYFATNPGAVKPGHIQQACNREAISPEGRLQGIPVGYAGHSRHEQCPGGGGVHYLVHPGNWTGDSGLGYQAPVFSPNHALDPHNYQR
jgi:hypothetical protein